MAQAVAHLTTKPRRLKPRPPSARRMTHSEFRARAEALTDAMIALLDELDGDENLEPSLAGFSATGGDDREYDAGDEAESGADDDLGADDLDGCGRAVAL